MACEATRPTCPASPQQQEVAQEGEERCSAAVEVGETEKVAAGQVGETEKVAAGQARSWAVVATTWACTFLFYGIVAGWASLQRLLELDGVFLESCPAEAPQCSARAAHFVMLFTVATTAGAISGVPFGFVADWCDLQTSRAISGVGLSAGLLIFGVAASKELLTVGCLLITVAGNLGMALTIKATFIVPKRHAHTVTIGVNCLMDASSVVPQVPLLIHQAGASRAAIFAVFAGLCAALHALNILLWMGGPSKQLRSVIKAEAEEAGELEKPPLHGKPLLKQVASVEFALAGTWLALQIYRSQFYLALIVELLRLHGDTGTYADIFVYFLPASILFVPVLNWWLLPRGFVWAFSAALALGVIWNAIAFVPSLPLQIIAFASFTNFRAFCYAVYFVFITHTFGASSTASVHGIAMVAGASANFLIWPGVAFVNSYLGGDLQYLLGLCLILCLPFLVLLPLLQRRLCEHPTAEYLNAQRAAPKEVAKVPEEEPCSPLAA